MQLCKIVIIRFISNLKFKKILFFKPAFIKVARTTKLSHHPVCLPCQSRLQQHVSLNTVTP